MTMTSLFQDMIKTIQLQSHKLDREMLTLGLICFSKSVQISLSISTINVQVQMCEAHSASVVGVAARANASLHMCQ